MLINISDHGGKIILAGISESNEQDSCEYPFFEDQKITLDIRPFGTLLPVKIDAVIKRILMRDGGMSLGVFIDEVFDEEAVFTEFLGRCRKFSELT